MISSFHGEITSSYRRFDFSPLLTPLFITTLYTITFLARDSHVHTLWWWSLRATCTPDPPKVGRLWEDRVMEGKLTIISTLTEQESLPGRESLLCRPRGSGRGPGPH
jgi:hypothetical protein